MGVEPSKGCLPMRMSKAIPIAGAPPRSVERRLCQIACQWVWNLRLTLGKMMQGVELREMEWAPPTETAPLFFTWEIRPKRMVRGSALERRDERLVVLPQMPSPMPRQWDAPLSSGS